MVTLIDYYGSLCFIPSPFLDLGTVPVECVVYHVSGVLCVCMPMSGF